MSILLIASDGDCFLPVHNLSKWFFCLFIHRLYYSIIQYSYSFVTIIRTSFIFVNTTQYSRHAESRKIFPLIWCIKRCPIRFHIYYSNFNVYINLICSCILFRDLAVYIFICHQTLHRVSWNIYGISKNVWTENMYSLWMRR